jgi:anti-anti-sigma factor
VTGSGRHAVVALVGEIDVATASEVKSCLERCLAEGGVDVSVDLSEVTFLGSPGLSVLLSFKRKLEPPGGHLRLRNPSPNASKVLGISGLASSLEIIATDSGATGTDR